MFLSYAAKPSLMPIVAHEVTINADHNINIVFVDMLFINQEIYDKIKNIIPQKGMR
jgi:hypothetical protein